LLHSHRQQTIRNPRRVSELANETLFGVSLGAQNGEVVTVRWLSGNNWVRALLAGWTWLGSPRRSFRPGKGPACPKLPKLLEAYLALGARICGPPALDRKFKTINFLTLLDLKTLPARIAEKFLR